MRRRALDASAGASSTSWAHLVPLRSSQDKTESRNRSGCYPRRGTIWTCAGFAGAQCMWRSLRGSQDNAGITVILAATESTLARQALRTPLCAIPSACPVLAHRHEMRVTDHGPIATVSIALIARLATRPCPTALRTVGSAPVTSTTSRRASTGLPSTTMRSW